MQTKQLIIKATLKILLDKSFESVSLRDVSKLAQVNLASISYHFGNKEGLIKEICSRILDPINLRRIELLEQAIERNKGIENTSHREIFEAFLRPIVLLDSDEIDHVLLSKLAAYFANNKDVDFSEKSEEIYKRLLISNTKALFIKTPGMSVEDIRTRLIFASGAAMQYLTIVDRATAMTNEKDQMTHEELLENLLEFILHGFVPRAIAGKNK